MSATVSQLLALVGEDALVCFRGRVWRFVDSQNRVSTAKLTSSAERQHALENLLEESKPPRRDDAPLANFLLTTPFRYPPLKHGSRFGKRSERSIIYASQAVATCLAECAYYAFYFRAASRAKLGRRERSITLFQLALRSERALDTTSSAYAECQPLLRSPVSYRATQQVGSLARERRAELIVFTSARCPQAGANVGVFAEAALAEGDPLAQHHWSEVIDDSLARYSCRTLDRHPPLDFSRTLFEVEGAVPMPAA